MAARQNETSGAGAGASFQRHNKAKSSHPVGHFRDKSKYNNRNGRFANQDGEQEHQGIQAPHGSQAPRATNIDQKEMEEHLTAKLRANKFVEVKTKEKRNKNGPLYEIDVINPGLFRIGNGTFFTMKLHTVSHKSRVIFIKIIFNDDEARNADMLINADAIIQIFREIAPDTIEPNTIEIKYDNDSKGNNHLAVCASTIKGASLNFTYERAMQFVHAVDENYGSPASASASASASGKDSAVASTEDITIDQINAESALLEKKLKALQELKQAKSSQPSKEASADTNTTNPDAASADAASADTNTTNPDVASADADTTNPDAASADADTTNPDAASAVQRQTTKPRTRPIRVTVGKKIVYNKQNKNIV